MAKPPRTTTATTVPIISILLPPPDALAVEKSTNETGFRPWTRLVGFKLHIGFDCWMQYHALREVGQQASHHLRQFHPYHNCNVEGIAGINANAESRNIGKRMGGTDRCRG